MVACLIPQHTHDLDKELSTLTANHCFNDITMPNTHAEWNIVLNLDYVQLLCIEFVMIRPGRNFRCVNARPNSIRWKNVAKLRLKFRLAFEVHIDNSVGSCENEKHARADGI